MTNVGDFLIESELLATLWKAFPFLVVDTATGRILRASPVCETVFGFDEIGGMQGRHIEELLPERLRAVHVEHRTEYAKDPYPRLRPMGLVGEALMGRRKTGEEFPIEVLLRPAVIGGLSCTLALVADMSGKLHLMDRGHGPSEPPHAG